MSRRTMYLLMCAVVTMWAGAFVAIKVLLNSGLSVWTIALLRFVLTTAGLWAVVAVRRPTTRPIAREHHLPIVAMGVCGVAIYHLSLNFGERFISPNAAPLIIATMPVMVALLAASFLGENLNAAKWAGIGLAVAGIAVLVLWGTPDADLSVRNAAGAAVTLLSPAAWAVYTILSKRLVSTYGALPLSTWAITTGTILLTPFAIVPAARDLGSVGATDWLWLAFLAFGCTVFAYVVWFRALEELDASKVAAWVYLVPVLAQVWGWIVLREPVTPFLALGGVMVLVGVIVIERVAPQRLAAGRPAHEAAAPAPEA